ncbi:MAG: hypothetical protein ABIC40_07565 [bacterium]
MRNFPCNDYGYALLGADEPVFCKAGEGYMILTYKGESYKFPQYSWPIQLTSDRIVYASKKGNAIYSFDLASKSIKQYKVKGTVYSFVGENCEFAASHVTSWQNKFYFYRLPVDSEPILEGELISKKLVNPHFMTVREESLYIINEGLLYRCDENGLNEILDLSNYINVDAWHREFWICDDIAESNDTLYLDNIGDLYVIDVSSTKAQLKNIYKSILPYDYLYSLMGNSVITFNSGDVKWYDLSTGSCIHRIKTPYTDQDVTGVMRTCDDRIVLITRTTVVLVATESRVPEFNDFIDMQNGIGFGHYCNENTLYIGNREGVWEIKSGT